MKRIILSCVLAFALIFTMIPVVSFAEFITVDISESKLISVDIDNTDLEYDGCAKLPVVSVKYGKDTIFTQKQDFSTVIGSGLKDISTLESPSEVTFYDNIEAGTATAKINLELEGTIASYTGSLEKEFTITKRPISSDELFSVNCADREKSIDDLLKDSSYKNIYEQACDELDKLIQDVAREYDGTTASKLKTAYAIYITSPKSYDLVAVNGTASYKNAGVSDTAQLCFTPSAVSNAQSQNYYLSSYESTVIDSKITKKSVVVAPENMTITVNETPKVTFTADGIETDEELSNYISGLSSDDIEVTDANGNIIDLSIAVSVPGKYTIALKNEAAEVELEKYSIRAGSAALTVKGDTEVETADRYKMGFEAHVDNEGIAAIASIYTEKLNEVGSEGDIGYAELDFTSTGKNVTGVSIPLSELQKVITELEKNPFVLGFYVTTSKGSLKFDAKAISVLAAEAQLAGNKNLEVGFEEVEQTSLTTGQAEELSDYNIIRLFKVYARCGEKEVKDVVGNLEVLIPYNVPSGMYWYKYILKTFDSSKKMTDRIAIYDEDAGTVSVTVNKLSNFALAYEKCDGSYACPSYWFDDVKNGDWFHEAVDYVVSAGIMNGIDSSTFSPNSSITRGMIVTILWRMQNKPESATPAFKDVVSGSYYEQAIGWAAAAGIVYGYDQQYFGPNDPVTREQIAAILYRYTKYIGKNVENTTTLESFSDYDKVSSYALEEMKWAYGAGLITGTTGNRLDPQGTATRAQVAAILQRYA